HVRRTAKHPKQSAVSQYGYDAQQQNAKTMNESPNFARLNHKAPKYTCPQEGTARDRPKLYIVLVLEKRNIMAGLHTSHARGSDVLVTSGGSAGMEKRKGPGRGFPVHKELLLSLDLRLRRRQIVSHAGALEAVALVGAVAKGLLF
ncbi:MAG TPA: hypothetical protein VHE81_21670, partial [Lacipirellulaceae bacterium]|nr:hypothetical protein [Lacipirellulaceae bacterium]